MSRIDPARLSPTRRWKPFAAVALASVATVAGVAAAKAGQPGQSGPLPWSPQSSPMTVGVDSFGNHQGGNATVTIAHPGVGHYVVTFNHALSNCPTVATLTRGMNGAFNPAFDGPAGEISTVPAFDPSGPQLIADKVVVTTRNSAGALTNQPFWLVVYC